MKNVKFSPKHIAVLAVAVIAVAIVAVAAISATFLSGAQQQKAARVTGEVGRYEHSYQVTMYTKWCHCESLERVKV